MNRLRISADGRRILRPDGRPFFYLADTAWELFHRLTLDEARHYLTTRAGQGFTAVLATLLAEFDGLRTPNPQGHVPFHDLDPCRPNEAYFADCDRIIEETARLGMFAAVLPTWGDKWNSLWGEGPLVFNPENAFVYGAYIGRRYRDLPVIWVLGGDRPVQTARQLETLRQMARGIRSASPDQLTTFHPAGGHSSAEYVHGEDWLDFNMLQTGHTGRDNPVGRMIGLDLARLPRKPTLDGEPNYEDHPVMAPGWKAIDNEWFDAFDCRKQAWRSVLAGACGHTYGCHDVWQMWTPAHKPVNHVRTPWPEAIQLPGARQMAHVRSLCEQLAWERLVGDDSLFDGGPGSGAEQGAAARATDGSYGLLYLPVGRPVRVDTRRLREPLLASWYDPRTGALTATSAAPDGTYAPPTPEDWVLYLRQGPA
ncbi:MAG: DUF4038 domain-containing protein [Tepidisphaerales bacterium]